MTSAYGIYFLIAYLENYNQRKLLALVLGLVLISFPYTLFIQELNTNISSEENNLPGVEGHGLAGETVNAALWSKLYINENERILNCETQIFEMNPYFFMKKFC